MTIFNDLIALDIYSTSGEKLRLLSGDELLALKYSVKLNDIGMLAFTINYESWSDDTFALDYLVDVLRWNEQSAAYLKEDTYLMRRFERFLDEEDNEIRTIGAFSLNHFLMRRIIDGRDDAIGGVGEYAIYAGESTACIRDLCLSQIGSSAPADRAIESLTIAASLDGLDAGGKYNIETILFDAVKELAIRGEVDFWIHRTSSNLFTLDIRRIGEDKTYETKRAQQEPSVVFTPERGNLLELRYIDDREKEQNFAYVAGEGQAGNRFILKRGTTARFDSPWNRIEFFTTAEREQGNSVTMLTKASSELQNRRAKKAFSFRVPSEVEGARYQTEYEIGDKVTALWGSYRQDLRVIGIENTYTKGEEQLNILVSQDVLSS